MHSKVYARARIDLVEQNSRSGSRRIGKDGAIRPVEEILLQDDR